MSKLEYNGLKIYETELKLIVNNIKGLVIMLNDNRDIYFFNDIFEIAKANRENANLYETLNLISLLNRLGIVKYVRTKPPRKYMVDKQKLNDFLKFLVEYYKQFDKTS